MSDLQDDLQRTSLSQQIVARLTELLESGAYTPGDDFIAEQEAVSLFHVSRPVVREAYQTLAGQGYILISKGRRARVLPPGVGTLNSFFDRVLGRDLESWRQLMDVRESLETLSAETAALRRTPEDVQQLRHICAMMQEQIEDPAAYTSLDITFHLALAAASENTYLRYLIESARHSLARVLTEVRGALAVTELPRVQMTHLHIVDAVDEGNPKAARKAMRSHFRTIHEYLGKENKEP